MSERRRTEKGYNVEVMILKAAKKIFAEVGYTDFRMVNLAAEVNMPLGAISYYYKKKTSILEKTYADYDMRIYGMLSHYEWFNTDTSLFKHICSSIIFYTNILNDPACLRFFVEVSTEEKYSEFYFAHILEKYDDFLKEYNVEVKEEKFKACILLDFGSRNEFWLPFIRNEIKMETPEALKLTLNLMPLLLGIDHKEMERIYAKAFERLAFVNYSYIKLV